MFRFNINFFSETAMGPLSLINECNINCGCNEKIYTPVCGPENITYVSPCFAGCSNFTSDKSGKIEVRKPFKILTIMDSG